MVQNAEELVGHVIVCGWGRVGRSCADFLHKVGRSVAVVDRDPARLVDPEFARVVGDVSDKHVLVEAGIMRAGALIAALGTDPDNVWLTVSARELRPDLTIVARAREERARSKLLRAGATRVVNPQVLGGRRLAESAVQRHVADFLEAVLHEESSDHRMAGFEIDAGSALVGRTLAEAALGERTGALVIAVRDRAEGWFVINPSPGMRLAAGSVVIVVGTASQLAALRKHSMPT